MFLDVEDVFLRAYLQAAFWSSSDYSDESGGVPFDDEKYDESDLAPEALARMRADCEAFKAKASKWLEPQPYGYGDGSDYDRTMRAAGHDFWLNRNGHGCGFWDGDWPEPQATELDKLAKSFGEVNLCVGDDGKIYCEGG